MSILLTPVLLNEHSSTTIPDSTSPFEIQTSKFSPKTFSPPLSQNFIFPKNLSFSCEITKKPSHLPQALWLRTILPNRSSSPLSAQLSSAQLRLSLLSRCLSPTELPPSLSLLKSSTEFPEFFRRGSKGGTGEALGLGFRFCCFRKVSLQLRRVIED